MPANKVEIENLRRVIVLGTSGSGKTTFARKLSKLLGAKYIELDAINWLANWQERDPDEFKRLVDQETRSGEWVLDGNYSRVREMTWRRATALIWLNYPFSINFYRSVSRTVRRVISREVLYSGNRESFRQSFLSRDSIIFWVLKTYRRRRRQYSELLQQDEWRDKEIFVFTRPREAEDFLGQVKKAKADGVKQFKNPENSAESSTKHTKKHETMNETNLL